MADTLNVRIGPSFSGPNIWSSSGFVSALAPLLVALRQSHVDQLESLLQQRTAALWPQKLSQQLHNHLPAGHRLGLICALFSRNLLNQAGAAIEYYSAAAHGPAELIIRVGFFPGAQRHAQHALVNCSARLLGVAQAVAQGYSGERLATGLAQWCQQHTESAPADYPKPTIAAELRELTRHHVPWLLRAEQPTAIQVGWGSEAQPWSAGLAPTAINKIPTVLIIADASSHSTWLAQLRDQLALTPDGRLAGLAINTAKQSWLNGTTRQTSTVAQLLCDRTCQRLLLLRSRQQLVAAGLPITQFDLIINGDVTPLPQLQFNLCLRHSNILWSTSLTEQTPITTLIAKAIARLAESPKPFVSTIPSYCQLPAAQSLTLNWLNSDALRLQSGPCVMALVKNEMTLLPHFLNHYRDMGVDRFIFYDDDSTDGSRDFLLQQPDCAVCASDHRFNQILSDGTVFHQAVKRLFTEMLAPGQWSLIVDVDELLFIPAQYQQQLAPFIRDLEAENITQVTAPMVDMYPRNLQQLVDTSCDNPWQLCQYFDRTIGYYRDFASGRFIKAYGGVRPRLIQHLYKHHRQRYTELFSNAGYTMPATWKTPLIQSGSGLHLVNSHNTNGVAPHSAQCVLAHFKFNADLSKKIAMALQLRQHYLGSIDYRILATAIELYPGYDLFSPATVLFEGVRSFEDAGLIFFHRAVSGQTSRNSVDEKSS